MKRVKNIIRKAMTACVAAACLFGMTACQKAPDIPVIGVSQYGEHASLDNCREGFLQGLADAGLTEGKDFSVNYQNAGFDDNMAIQIANNLAAKDVAKM